MIATEQATRRMREQGLQPRLLRLIRRNPMMIGGLLLLTMMVIVAVGAPYWNTVDPLDLNPIERLRAPSMAHWFGTDMLGRDLYSRTVYGSRISLFVGLCVAVLSLTSGLVIGLLSGYHRHVDAVVMRVMDGMMAIPAILLAIALMALMSASVQNVIIALTIPEIPRVVRLVRAVVLQFARAGVCRSIEGDRCRALARSLAAYHAQHLGAPDCARDLYLCFGGDF